MTRSTSGRLALAACFFATLAFVTQASAATRTWTGAASGAWNNASNWGGVLPVAGDDLVFPSGASNTTNNNDFPAGTSFSSITVNATYVISGNAVTLTAASALTFQTAATASINFSIPVTLTNAAAAIATPQPDPITLSVQIGPVTIGGGALLLPIAGNATQVYFQGPISETAPASITKSGNTVAYLNAANTFSGQLIVNQGYIVANNNGSLGTGTNSAADGTVVNAGGSLSLGTVNIPNERVVLSGAGQSGNGAFQSSGGAAVWGGDIVINTASVAMNLLGASLAITGRITGSGPFQFGRAPVTISNPANDYAGATVIGAPSGDVPALILGASGVIPDASSVTIQSGAVMQLNGRTETIGALGGAGALDTTNGSLTTGGNNTSSTLSGVISGNGTITKVGTGTQTLSGPSAGFTGSVVVNSGTLSVNGTLGGTITVNGGTLAGSGTAGVVSLVGGPGGGTLAPGSTSPGIFTMTSLNLSAGAQYVPQLNGANPGSAYDQVSTGSVTLGGGLTATLGYVPNLGQVFRIIDNTGANPVSGTFAGLPEGAFVTVGTVQMRISYVGGTGNDVTLTVTSLSPPPAPTITTTSPLPGGTVGTAYSTTIAGTGGTTPYTWSVTAGALPPGLTLNAASGLLSGTPTTAGAYNFTVTLTDAASQTASTPFALTIAAAPPPVSTQPVPALGPWMLALLGVLTALGGMLAVRKRG